MTQMLAHLITPAHRFTRSANLDRDAGQPSLAGYQPTSSALEATRRVITALIDPAAHKAISITGPYGTGKSTLAVFLSALLGPSGSSRIEARRMLQERAPDTAHLLQRLPKETEDAGVFLLLATARREPVSSTLERVIRTALKDLPVGLRRKIEGHLDSGPRGVVEAVEIIATHRPTLIIIDELGKNLEEFAHNGNAAADLYALQELAEWAQGADSRLVLVTLQHLAFADYEKDKTRAREWHKIQGRFLDLPFTDSVDEQHQLISTVYEHSIDISRWVAETDKALKREGLSSLVHCEIASLYPLHPVTVAVLPEICARHGQNERTLFSFLAGPDSLGVPTWLNDQPLSAQSLPSVRLDRVWDYFAGTSTTAAAATIDAARLMEIQARIRDHAGLNDPDLRVLKAIAVLNLVADGGQFRASKSIVRLACTDGQQGTKTAADVDKTIARLETQGLITYRGVSDEYRVWQGSDYDVTAAVDLERSRIADSSAASLLQGFRPLQPVVAARHSQRVGVLRAFGRTFYDATEGKLPQVDGQDLDGLVVIVLEPNIAKVLPDGILDLAERVPVVIGIPENPALIIDAAVDVGAHADALRRAKSAGADWVALRELRERHAAATVTLDHIVEQQCGSTSASVRWYRVENGKATLVRGKRTLSSVLSNVCDDRYPAAPLVRNEMLARRSLTSQGARARRELLTAMIENPHEPLLGLEGYAPERAMYEALLAKPGIHKARQGVLGFGAPRRNDTFNFGPAWQAIEDALVASEGEPDGIQLDGLYRRLMAPPLGLKEGVIPVVLIATLLSKADTVAIFETGTFVARLTAPIMERLIRNPELFTLRQYPLNASRRAAIQAIAETLKIDAIAPPGTRNAATVTVVSGLLSRIRSLPEFSRQTRNLPETALQVRDALTSARDPEALLFDTLPHACGTKLSDPPTATEIKHFANGLDDNMSVLSEAYPALLSQAWESVATGFQAPSAALRTNVQGRLDHMRGRRFDPAIDALISALTDPSLSDNDWIEFVAMLIAGKPAPAWSDADVEVFTARSTEMTERIRRLEAVTFDSSKPQTRSTPLRVGVTRADGADTSRVVWLDTASNRALEDIVTAALKRAETELGTAGREALLARIAMTVLADSNDMDQSTPVEETA